MFLSSQGTRARDRRRLLCSSRMGDFEKIRSLLADDVVAYADGGGKSAGVDTPLVGIDAVMARHAQLAQEFRQSPSRLVRYACINGLHHDRGQLNRTDHEPAGLRRPDLGHLTSPESGQAAASGTCLNSDLRSRAIVASNAPRIATPSVRHVLATSIPQLTVALQSFAMAMRIAQSVAGNTIDVFALSHSRRTHRSCVVPSFRMRRIVGRFVFAQVPGLDRQPACTLSRIAWSRLPGAAVSDSGCPKVSFIL